MDSFNVFFPMEKIPTATHQGKKVNVRNGKPQYYEPDAQNAARGMFMARLGSVKPKAPFDGPLSLIIKWAFPADRKHPAGMWKTTKPDTDNLIKMIKDCMTACGYWKDDSQVVQERSEKFYWDVPGIYIKIDRLGDGQNETN
jgi:Holliday junction resolvase RusA-like endonuclease